EKSTLAWRGPPVGRYGIHGVPSDEGLRVRARLLHCLTSSPPPRKPSQQTKFFISRIAVIVPTPRQLSYCVRSGLYSCVQLFNHRTHNLPEPVRVLELIWTSQQLYLHNTLWIDGDGQLHGLSP